MEQCQRGQEGFPELGEICGAKAIGVDRNLAAFRGFNAGRIHANKEKAAAAACPEVFYKLLELAEGAGVVNVRKRFVGHSHLHRP